jgi:hypothetical protein
MVVMAVLAVVQEILPLQVSQVGLSEVEPLDKAITVVVRLLEMPMGVVAVAVQVRLAQMELH